MGNEEILDSIESAEDMPKPIRGIQGRTSSVKSLMEVVGDLKPHRILDVKDKDAKEKLGRKLRYAAKLKGVELETVWIPEDNPAGDPPGFYFKGYPKGEAPKRGLRK